MWPDVEISVMDDSSSVCSEQAAVTAVDPVFVDYHDWLVVPPGIPDTRLLDHLAHRVSRNPADLLSHVQRVILCADQRRVDETYGTLLDLFIVLGDKGYALRLRLLNKCRGVLSTQQYGTLKAAALSGLSAIDVVPEAEHSRLCAGISGSLKIVSMTDAHLPAPGMSVLNEARDLINSDRIESARKLLESALLASPQDEEISRELLAIYRHTLNYAGLTAMLEKLPSAALAALEEWQALVEHLASGNKHEPC